MKLNISKAFTNSELITLKDDEWLQKQRIAGRIAAGALLLLETEVKNGTTKTMLELDKLAETYIRDNGCVPTFLMYKNFPNSVCISVNKQLVHGIPSGYQLRENDLCSFDLGASYNGSGKRSAIADTAITCIFGEGNSKQKQIVKDTEEALMRGINAIKINSRLGAIGQAIYKYGNSKGYGVITNYGGHGLDWDYPHTPPFVANRSTENEGPRLVTNMTLAIEPMLTSGSVKTWTDTDGWTVHSEAEYSAHFEHSVFLHKNGYCEIITSRK